MRWCCLVWVAVDLSLGSVAHHLGRLKTKRGLRWCECNKAKILDAPSGQCGGENMMLMTLMRIWWREVADGWCGVRCLCGRRSWGCRHDRYGTIMDGGDIRNLLRKHCRLKTLENDSNGRYLNGSELNESPFQVDLWYVDAYSVHILTWPRVGGPCCWGGRQTVPGRRRCSSTAPCRRIRFEMCGVVMRGNPLWMWRWWDLVCMCLNLSRQEREVIYVTSKLEVVGCRWMDCQ